MWWLVAAGAALYFLASGGGSGKRGGAAGGVRVTGGSQEQAIRRWANRWGAIFDVPAAFIVRIASIESSFKPGTVNKTERALPSGGAWGPMQVLLTTARGLVPALQAIGRQHPDVATALRKWNDTGESMLDAELGTLFGAYYLSRLYNVYGFKEWPLVAAAYQQGPGTVKKAVAAGDTGATIGKSSNIGPHGRTYVAMAEKAVSKVG